MLDVIGRALTLLSYVRVVVKRQFATARRKHFQTRKSDLRLEVQLSHPDISYLAESVATASTENTAFMDWEHFHQRAKALSQLYQDILGLLLEGVSNTTTALQLHITPRTVRKACQKIRLLILDDSPCGLESAFGLERQSSI